MAKVNGKTVSLTAEELSEFELEGRPFLSEQGRTVTRGIVVGFRWDRESWHLDLRDVDYLDKSTRVWQRKRADDTYSSTDSYFAQVFKNKRRTKEKHLIVGGYGINVFIGPKISSPWTSVVWGNVLGTDHFDGGILGEEQLPPS